MKPYLIFTFCCLSFAGICQEISIKNLSQQSDSSIQLFKNYLISKEALNSENQTLIRIEDYSLGLNSMNLDFVGYQMGNSIFKDFNASINFEVSDSTIGLSYHGIILENQVFVNTIDFYNFLNPNFQQTSAFEHYNNVLKEYYPNYKLDSEISHFVIDETGKYVGEFHLEYKTKTRDGCLVTDNYSLIQPNSYTVLGKAYNCEPVIVFYYSASTEFLVDKQCVGDQFEMYDKYNQLIHKGVISRYTGY